MRFRPCLLFMVAALGLAGPLRADLPETIRRARAQVAPEPVLETLESVQYRGTLTSTETRGDGTTATIEARIEIVFQRPYQQKIVLTSDERIEVTALDDYEGWQRLEDPANPAAWKLTLLGKEQIKRLRANTWENLAFYRGLEQKGGVVRDLGVVELDGREAHKLAFVHDEGIVFTRYFDLESGQLLQTETEQGARIREQGEMMVDGIRFPERVITDTPLADGGHRVVTVEFDDVVVNERISAESFRVPFMAAR